MSLAIESLFHKYRFSGGPSLFFIVLYAPLGLVLLTLRIFISLQLCLASLVLPSGTFLRKIILRILYVVMGVVVREKDWGKKDEKCCILISNHITPFDHLAISMVYPCISVNSFNLPHFLSSILCYKDFGVTRGREVLQQNIQTYLRQPDSLPLLLHPEGATTNGTIALMKFIFLIVRIALARFLAEVYESCHQAMTPVFSVRGGVKSCFTSAQNFMLRDRIKTWNKNFEAFRKLTKGRRLVGSPAKDRKKLKDYDTHEPFRGSVFRDLRGFMQYGAWCMEFDNSVMVLGLQVHRIPFLPISPSILGSSWMADLFYALFSPVTIYTVRYIGKLTKQELESANDFAMRAQKATAAALHLQVSNHNVADKLEYIKRLAREEAAAANPFLNPEIHVMALQVKEVLSYLPLDIIKRDLIRTRNVDMTITNFLEGNIPEPIPSFVSTESTSSTSSTLTVFAANSSSCSVESSSEINVTLNPSIDTHNLNMAAKTFAKSAHDRMQSFHERKTQLIEKARMKYIKKHNLKIPGINC